MTSQLSSQFDPLGVVSPLLLGGKLILQKVASSGLGCNENVSEDKKWLSTSSTLEDYAITRNYLAERIEPISDVSYQLHGFCDASDSAFLRVVYLRGVHDGRSHVNFVIGKSKVVLTHQKGWVIARKELEAAELLGRLMHSTSKAIQNLNCTAHYWTDSQVVLKWIVNPDLSLARFVKRRVDKIYLIAPPSSWNYVNTLLNPADVGTRECCGKQPTLLYLWQKGPSFLLQGDLDVKMAEQPVVVQKISCSMELLLDSRDFALDKLIQAAPNLYTLKKRCAYLTACVEFTTAKKLNTPFQKPCLDSTYLDKAFIKIVKFVQSRFFGGAVELFSQESPDAFESTVKKLICRAKDEVSIRRVSELKTLRRLRPCVGSDGLLRIKDRLENAELPADTKHPFILPGRHPIIRLVVLHNLTGHGGLWYTLMKTRERFWVIHGVSRVKFYIADCGKCALLKAKPIRQLMSELPSCRVTACN